jgi:competence ComEA-like helix-hairpin-helix protein
MIPFRLSLIVMLQRPFYQTSIAFLSLLALAGGIALLLAQGGPAGVVITPPAELARSDQDAPGSLIIPGKPGDLGDLGATRGLLDLNSATASELEVLPGVGPVLSGRVVVYREANGRFERADQLMAVTGIGPATYEAIRDLVTVGD